MIDWVVAHTADIIILTVVIVLSFLGIRSLLNGAKAGGSCCGCTGCSGCSAASRCREIQRKKAASKA